MKITEKQLKQLIEKLIKEQAIPTEEEYFVGLSEKDPDISSDILIARKFSNIDSAMELFKNPEKDPDFKQEIGVAKYDGYEMWIMIDGPDFNDKKLIAQKNPQRQKNSNTEIAMQAGMGMGIQSYNDHMEGSRTSTKDFLTDIDKKRIKFETEKIITEMIKNQEFCVDYTSGKNCIDDFDVWLKLEEKKDEIGIRFEWPENEEKPGFYEVYNFVKSIVTKVNEKLKVKN